MEEFEAALATLGDPPSPGELAGFGLATAEFASVMLSRFTAEQMRSVVMVLDAVLNAFARDYPDRMGRAVRVTTWVAVALLIAVILVFAGIRFATDLPHLLAGTEPHPRSFEAAYVANPAPAYLHIIPGVLYLLGATLQLSRRFRGRHLPVHRRLGRVLVVLALASGVFALVFGIPNAYGGASESLATAVFGSWFLACLVAGYLAARRRDTRSHRRWMIRGFAIGLGVGSIRVWVGLLSGAGPLSLSEGLAWGFWLGLGMHAAVAELWLLWRPDPPARVATAVPASAEA